MSQPPRWCDDDAFWAFMLRTMYHPDRMARTPAECEGVVAMLGLKPGDRVLDLPCGIGRHSLELARRGMHVTGVDRTRLYLDKAREAERAAPGASPVEWVEGNMRTFERRGAFDAVINMYTSFGYFDAPGQDLTVLKHWHASLKPGGRLLIDLHGKETIAKVFKEHHWSQAPDGLIELMHVRPADDWSRMEHRWIFIDEGKAHEFHVEFCVYAASELKRLLKETGFVEVRCFGALTGEPYDHNAKRLIVTGKRGE